MFTACCQTLEMVSFDFFTFCNLLSTYPDCTTFSPSLDDEAACCFANLEMDVHALEKVKRSTRLLLGLAESEAKNCSPDTAWQNNTGDNIKPQSPTQRYKDLSPRYWEATSKNLSMQTLWKTTLVLNWFLPSTKKFESLTGAYHCTHISQLEVTAQETHQTGHKVKQHRSGKDLFMTPNQSQSGSSVFHSRHMRISRSRPPLAAWGECCRKVVSCVRSSEAPRGENLCQLVGPRLSDTGLWLDWLHWRSFFFFRVQL